MKNLDMDIDRYVSNLKCEIEKMNPMIQNMWPRTAEIEDMANFDIAQNITL